MLQTFTEFSFSKHLLKTLFSYSVTITAKWSFDVTIRTYFTNTEIDTYFLKTEILRTIFIKSRKKNKQINCIKSHLAGFNCEI